MKQVVNHLDMGFDIFLVLVQHYLAKDAINWPGFQSSFSGGNNSSPLLLTRSRLYMYFLYTIENQMTELKIIEKEQRGMKKT